MTTKQKKKLLKAKIAVALQDELGRVPKEQEINQVLLLTRVNVQSNFRLAFQTTGAEESQTTGYLLRGRHANRLRPGLNLRPDS
jgi:hypothetical protein